MKIIKNCALALGLTIRYAPWNAMLYILACIVPGFFGGLRVILVQRLIDAGVGFGATGQGTESLIATGTALVALLFVWFQLGREFGGSELSGGEWQKVAIARGLFRDSRLIVLDEPTSALDPLVEYEILTGFLKLIQGKTSVIISRRVGICRHADKVVVMKDGKVVECGRHEELVRAGGEYARIWGEQAKWYWGSFLSGQLPHDKVHIFSHIPQAVHPQHRAAKPRNPLFHRILCLGRHGGKELLFLLIQIAPWQHPAAEFL